MNIILLASVPHTGTIFCQQFLEQHPAVGNTVGLTTLSKSRGIFRDPYTGQQGLIPGTTNLVWTHINEDTIRATRCFAFHVPTVIPMRDPLLSLATRKNRQPDTNHLWLVESWLVLATFIWPHATAAYYPVDLESRKSYSQKRKGLHELAQAAGLEPDNYIDTFAKDYQPANTRGDYDLKAMYKQRDFDQLKLHLSAEINQLQKSERFLRPMLEEVGYSDLMWWS